MILKRTTPSIDDGVLAAAKELAARQHKSIGEVVSTQARQALRPTFAASEKRNGIALLAVCANAAPVTLELVSQLCDAP
jgi:hypothetical protein